MKKIKILLYIILLSLTASFIACSDDERNEGYIKKEELPERAIQFLESYFPGVKIRSVQDQSLIWESTFMGYLVEMQDDMTVTFNDEGRWLEVTAENGLPESALDILDSDILDELAVAAPGREITMLKKQSSFYASLVSQIRIVLDNKEEYIDTYWYDNPMGEKKYLAKVITYSDLIKPIQDFFIRNVMPQIASSAQYISRVNLDNENGESAYRVSLGDDFCVIDFDEEGNWLNIKAQKTANANPAKIMSRIAMNEIPEKVMKTLQDFALSGGVRGELNQLTNYKERLYGVVIGDTPVLVDEEAGILEKNGEMGKTFMATHFPSIHVDKISVISQINSPYYYYFSYQARYSVENTVEATVYFILDENFELRNIAKSLGMDREFLRSLLPEAMNTYLAAHYKDTLFSSLMKYDDSIFTYSLFNEPGGFYLYFDEEGRFIQKSRLGS